jgi:putative FmdB family regulatory protein
MPIYEYRCGSCGHELEALQKMSDGPLRKCPECGKSQLRRMVSAPSFRLKGAGWYETDFKGDKEKKRNLVETAGADASDSSGSGTDSTKESASKEASAKVAEAKSSDVKGSDSANGAGNKPKPTKVGPKLGTATARKSAAKVRAKTSARS